MTHVVASQRPDYIAVSQSNFSPSLQFHVPDIRVPDTPFVHLAGGIREVVAPTPVMAVSKIPSIEAAQAVIAQHADLVAMSRPLIADAALVRKAESGEVPRPCVYCNVC